MSSTSTEARGKHYVNQLLYDDIPVRQFLLKTTLFKFLGFGSRCNAGASNSFSDAACDLRKLMNINKPNGLWYGIPMTEIFESGYDILHHVMDKTRSDAFSEEELTAWITLVTFFKEKDIHEKNILSAIEKMSSTEKSKESILKVALAEHLFGKLSPGQAYLVDSRIKGKENKWRESFHEKCRCGCGKKISLGATGIGHSEVWHGFADIMVMSTVSKPDCSANVCLELNFGHNDDGPSSSKKMISDASDDMDEEENEAECISEVKVLEKVQDQTAAQTVVFAMAYQTANPLSKVFIPNILICPSKFYIVMYEPINDVLVWSTEFPLFSQSDRRLQGVSVIALWMVMHYKLFCKEANEIFENVNEIKAGFRSHVDDDQWLIYKNQLRTGISTFESIQRLNLVQSLSDVDFDIPKLKVKKLRTM